MVEEMEEAVRKDVKNDVNAMTTSMETYLEKHIPVKEDDLQVLFMGYGALGNKAEGAQNGAFNITVPYMNTSMESLAKMYFTEHPSALVLPKEELDKFKKQALKKKPQTLSDDLEKAREISGNFHDFDYIAGPGGFCQLFASFFAVGVQANLKQALHEVFLQYEGGPLKNGESGVHILARIIASTLKYMNHGTFKHARGLRVLMRLGLMPSGLKDTNNLYFAERLHHTQPTCPKYGTGMGHVKGHFNVE
eukprot:Nk52_evm1s834 gene=Nk52_evmTU1s834